MEKIYVSPSAKKGVGYPSRYFYLLKTHLSKHFEVLEADSKPCLSQGTALLKNSLRADIFLLSFVESIGFQKLGFIQFLMAHISIWIMRMRHKKIIFIYHNIRPHQGENFMSKSIIKTLLKRSILVISHSKGATDFAIKQLHFFGWNADKVKYVCHPVDALDIKPVKPDNEADDAQYDVLIWGDILPYKGVEEFVTDASVLAAGLKVKIFGLCKYDGVEEKILASGFSFENKRASFEEIAWYCAHCNYVLFPYLRGSISSSGLLIDTVAMGGTPIGPALGAFKDLSDEGVCLIYNSIQEMVNIISDRENRTVISNEARRDFIEHNSWPNFVDILYRNV
jgi:beta-1,4-mannosyltransferase